MMKKSGFVENDNITLLAKGVLLRGEIRVEGTVRIDGRLEGDLHTTGTVVIGEDGIVQGTGSMQELSAMDAPAIRAFFEGPRARGAQDSATAHSPSGAPAWKQK